MMHWDGDGRGGWAVGMILMMLVFWGGIVAVFWMALATVQRGPRPSTAGRLDARGVLAERLARGDIDVEDYRRRLDALDSGD